MEILAMLSQTMLQCGKHQEAKICSETVLQQEPENVRALLTKAGALYELCAFEHSMKLYIRAQFLASDSGFIKEGISKCRKIISNKLEDDTVFRFRGSRKFLDILRKKGPDAIEKYLNNEDARLSLQFASAFVGTKPTISEFLPVKSQNAKKSKNKAKSNKQFKMQDDQAFISNLQKRINKTAALEVDLVRYGLTYEI